MRGDGVAGCTGAGAILRRGVTTLKIVTQHWMRVQSSINCVTTEWEISLQLILPELPAVST